MTNKTTNDKLSSLFKSPPEQLPSNLDFERGHSLAM